MNEDVNNEVSINIKERIQIKNAACFYQSFNIFNLPKSHKATLSYIERCFTIINDIDNFEQLDYGWILKILASSELAITSEIEVFKVAQRWLNYNIEERSKYARDLLFKVRLNLLSNDTIRILLNDSKILNNGDRCIEFLSEVLDFREGKIKNSLSIYHTSRYCNHKAFNLLVCGGYNSKAKRRSRNVSCVDVNSTKDVEDYPPMKAARNFLDAVNVKDDLYVFGGFDNFNRVMSVDKYSLTFKTWSKVAEMYDSRRGFCTCAFMNMIFFFGGFNDEVTTNSCFQFDTKDYSWKEVARINEARSNAACVVFDERIVIAGGMNKNYNKLDTVKSYDVLPDKWSPMPNMNSGKRLHSLVVVKNKLFVISKREDRCL